LCTFERATVTSYSYVNWADGEPNNWEEQDCVQLLPPWGHKWDDDFCNYQKKAICEKKGWKERVTTCFAEICRLFPDAK
jgi:hypothetical protein